MFRTSWADRRSAYATGQFISRIKADPELAKILCELLDIQADGGDTPSGFLLDCLEETKRLLNIRHHENKLKELKEIEQ